MTTMTRPAGPSVRGGRGWYAAVAVGSVLIAGYAATMVGSGLRLLPAEVHANHVTAFLWGHISFAAVALLLMPVQLSRRVRRTRPQLHRLSGRVYAGCALVGGTFGVLASLTTDNGVIAGAGFLTLGVLWVSSTIAAVVAARAHRFDDHRRWALRSAALIFAAVTLRIELGIGLALTQGDFAHVYPLIAWLSWVPNLLVAEWLIRRAGVVPVRLRQVD